MKGLVYTDLKMENILLDNFNPETPNDNFRDLIVRLADCGSITTSKLSTSTSTSTSTRQITSLTYRSPEVHFGKPWDQSTDVWSWGIIFTQLLQAKSDFHAPGIYDSLNTNTPLPFTDGEKEKLIRDQLAIDFDLGSVPFYAADEQCAKLLPTPQPEKAYMWANTMVEKDMAGEEDIQFLVEVLHPDPEARLTIPEILESGYLEG